MRIKLIAFFIFLVIVSVGGVVLLARSGTARGVRQFILHGGMTSGELVAALEDYFQQAGSWEGVEAVLSDVSSRGQGAFGRGMGGMMGQRLVVADESGQIFADSAGTATGSLNPEQIDQSVPLKGDWGRTIGFLYITGGMGFVPGDELPLLRQLNQAALQAALIAAAIALILGFVIAYQLVRPVQHLTGAAQRLTAGDLTQRVQVRGHDELAQLGTTFNQMAASLEEAQRIRRAMTADIAHELRTPLAVQRAQLEALQDGIYPLTVDNLQSLVAQNAHLSRLVEDLRLLALADAGELPLDRQPTDLAGLAEEVLTRYEPQADNRSIQLQIQRNTDRCVPVPVDAGRVNQILDNLLSNALRHTLDGGKITLKISCRPNEVLLTVEDSGPGIPSDSISHIFERFYRADRARAHEDGGAGLGLAIARQLAEAHGGTLTAGNVEGGGAQFVLSLPVEPLRI